MFDRLESDDCTVVTISLPNANLQEHMVCLTGTMRSGIRPDLVILPVVFDDTREGGIRRVIADWFSSLSAQVDQSCESESGAAKTIRSLLDEGKSKNRVGRDLTLQEIAEKSLDENIARLSQAWRKRGEIRGTIFYQLYLLRNRVFGITQSSVRRKIASRYSENLEALRTIIRFGNCEGFALLVYVAPLRNDISPPYDITEYEDFKAECMKICGEGSRSGFVDLEKIVPNQFWGDQKSTSGSTENQPDFMHFQSEGHQILADRLEIEIRRVLNGDK